MKRMTLGFMIYALFSNLLHATHIVDLYGASNEQSKSILKKYAKHVAIIQSELERETKKAFVSGKENVEKLKKIRAEKFSLEEKIKKEGSFLFVYLDTINYYTGNGKENIYTTIEVITENQPERLRFVNNENIINNKTKIKDDLINKMLEFDQIGLALRKTHKLNPNDNSCPVYSCTTGFSHPELKPYLKIFNTGSIQERKLILDTLNYDPDPERRAAACFLIGHFTDPQEIISILSPHLNDKSMQVRNNAMRVLWETMRKSHITKIDVKSIIELLDSPYDTDRNKALCVLLAASDSKTTKQFIIHNSKQQLVSLLQLKQPNNHEEAYFLLKKISGKKYGENNLEAWEQWASLG